MLAKQSEDMKKQISKQQELELVLKAREGCRRSNNILIKKYTPLVSKMALKYINICPNVYTGLDDLKQVGFMGVIEAIRTYSPSKKSSFFTWAFVQVRGYITKAVRKKDAAGRYPISLVNDVDDENSRSGVVHEVVDPSQTPNVDYIGVYEEVIEVMREVCGEHFPIMACRYCLDNSPEAKKAIQRNRMVGYNPLVKKFGLKYNEMRNICVKYEPLIQQALKERGLTLN